MTEALVKELKKLVDGGKLKQGEEVLRKAKFAMSSLQSLPPNNELTSTSKAERSLARDVYESAVVLSVKSKDMKSLERHLVLLRPFCCEYRSELGESPRRSELIALELLFLLVESRLAEFHSLLELVAMGERDDKYIAFVVSIEQYLMEGSYDKVLAARKKTPSDVYSWLLESLEETVRDEIASCIEVSYPVLSLVSTHFMLRKMKF